MEFQKLNNFRDHLPPSSNFTDNKMSPGMLQVLLYSMHCDGLGHMEQLHVPFLMLQGQLWRSAWCWGQKRIWLWTWKNVLGRIPRWLQDFLPMMNMLYIIPPFEDGQNCNYTECHIVWVSWSCQTKHHRLSSLNNNNLLSHGSGSQKSKARCHQGLAPSEAEENLFQASLIAFEFVGHR